VHPIVAFHNRSAKTALKSPWHQNPQFVTIGKKTLSQHVSCRLSECDCTEINM